jgi:TPR repeat protein
MFMLISSRLGGIILLGLGLYAPGARAAAFDAGDGARVEKAPLQIYANPRAALRAGLEGFRLGESERATEALKYAAEGGELLAQWKLAKIYASGDGVPRDDLRAYEYFSQIVTNYDEDNPDPRDAAIVSSAFVALGVYYLNGIGNGEVGADPQRALQLFQFAATNFGDASAQYNLARMHFDGAGVGKDDIEALRWLSLAADKGHVQAQALLGQLLFAGRDGVRPQRARGLMWLTLAREAAVDSNKDKWIIDLYEKAVASANEADRHEALAYLENHPKRRN